MEIKMFSTFFESLSSEDQKKIKDSGLFLKFGQCWANGHNAGYENAKRNMNQRIKDFLDTEIF